MADLCVSFPKPCDEQWEAMSAIGCNRHCQRCDHLIHDLTEHTADEIEALLRTQPKICVRASVGPNGQIRTKTAVGRRRVVLGVSASMLALGSPAMAGTSRTDGTIVGTVENGTFDVVKAIGPGGVEHNAKAKFNGKYKIKHLPPGPYTLDLTSDCRDHGPAPVVEVRAGEVVTAPNINNACIIIGMMSIESNDG